MHKNEKFIEYSPAADAKRSHGFANVRWVENVSRGLRRVGFADEILKLNHQGWFTEDDGDNGEVYRGVVYRLPARGTAELYVYGYADPNNDDCARLSFNFTTDKHEAAHLADDFAESFAEAERNYNRAWQAGREYGDLDAEIKEARKQALDISAEMRAARKIGVQAPTICDTLRAKVQSLRRHIQKAREKRAELLENFGSLQGFLDAKE